MPDDAISRIQPARPTIFVAGQEERELGQGLLELLVVETTSGMYRCEARFGNWGKVGQGSGTLYLDRQKLDFGKTLEVKLGDDGIFEGRITAIEAHFLEGASPEITVLAEDRLLDLRMARRTRTFEDTSDADVFRQVAQDHGLQADVDVAGPQHKVLIQHNQSDLAFVRERARTVDAEVWVEGSTLHARARAARNGGSVAMKHGKELLAFSVNADLSEQRSGVKVTGWDVASKAPLEHEADRSTLGSELGQDTSGAEILDNAFQARVETLVHRVPLSSQEAQAESEAQFKARARRFVVGWGRAQPNGKLRVGSYANLSGLGGLFDGKYYLAEVRHVFEGSKGSRTEFCAERPGIGQAP